MTTNEIIQIVTAFIGSLGFAILFNVRGIKLVIASLGGFLAWLLFVLLGYLSVHNEPIRYFIVAAAVSLYAEIMARIFRTPTTTFIITALIPLIPGSSLYYTMAYAFDSDMARFIEKGIYTLELAVALALGILAIGAVMQVVNTLHAVKKK